MRNKQKTIIDVLSESGRKILAEVKAEAPGDGLLDLISRHGSGCRQIDSEWTDLGTRPNFKDIDYSRTSDEMILEGRVILKDHRKAYWLPS